jgi:diguanylate cyclase (GGDEF)-like protein
MPRAHSFCGHAILGQDVMVVADARLDPRFEDNVLVKGADAIRFYAGAPVRSSSGHALGTVCVLDAVPRALSAVQTELLRDIAASVASSLELHRSMREANRLAMTDSLTGVGNRAYFHEALHREAARARRRASCLTVMYLDCDGFRTVNNELGHAAGDRLLRDISAAVRAQLRAGDIIGRIGGDEFAIILPETGQATACRIADRILAACRALASLHGRHVSASLGVSTSIAMQETAEDLLAAADAAMYAAKRAGRDRHTANVLRNGVTLAVVRQPATGAG